MKRTSSAVNSLRPDSLNRVPSPGRRRGCHRAVAEDLPRPACVDALAVDRHPFRDFLQNDPLFVIEFTAVGQREIQHQVAIAAYDVDQQIDHVLGRLVLGFPVVMPFADAAVGLPGVGRNAGGYTALPILNARPDFAVARQLACVHGFAASAMAFCLTL